MEKPQIAEAAIILADQDVPRLDKSLGFAIPPNVEAVLGEETMALLAQEEQGGRIRFAARRLLRH